MTSLKATQATVECTIARLLACVAVGLIAGLVAPKIGTHFQYAVSDLAQTGIGFAAGVLTWFATRRLFNFAADCLEVPPSGMSTAFQKSAPKPVRPLAAGVTPKPAPTTGPATLETFPQADGSVNVTITVTGLTKREFNALRGRLEQVRGVVWEHPKNLGESKRRMDGKLPAGPARPEALKRLEELTGNRF